METSTSGEKGDAASFDAINRRVTPGNCSVNRSMRGISQKDRSAATHVTVSSPLVAGLVIAAVAAAIPSNALVTAGRSSAPCGVSFRRLPLRSNRGVSNDCSKARIWWLIAPCVTLSSRAAADTEPRRAAASNARKGFSGGRRLGKRGALHGNLCEKFSHKTL